jgi:hypothetical protein
VHARARRTEPAGHTSQLPPIDKKVELRHGAGPSVAEAVVVSVGVGDGDGEGLGVAAPVGDTVAVGEGDALGDGATPMSCTMGTLSPDKSAAKGG